MTRQPPLNSFETHCSSLVRKIKINLKNSTIRKSIILNVLPFPKQTEGLGHLFETELFCVIFYFIRP
jgi:hypothetical protein